MALAASVRRRVARQQRVSGVEPHHMLDDRAEIGAQFDRASARAMPPGGSDANHSGRSASVAGPSPACRVSVDRAAAGQIQAIAVAAARPGCCCRR